MLRRIVLILVAIVPLLVTGCAAFPVDLGITTSDRPHATAQVCVLSADPIIVGEAQPDVRYWGMCKGWILLGAKGGYAQSTGVT